MCSMESVIPSLPHIKCDICTCNVHAMRKSEFWSRAILSDDDTNARRDNQSLKNQFYETAKLQQEWSDALSKQNYALPFNPKTKIAIIQSKFRCRRDSRRNKTSNIKWINPYKNQHNKNPNSLRWSGNSLRQSTVTMPCLSTLKPK